MLSDKSEIYKIIKIKKGAFALNWTIDIILILTAAITIIVYTFRGFVKSLFGIFKYIISFILSCIFAPALGHAISNNLLLNKVNGIVSGFISNIISKAESAIDIEGLISKLPSAISNMLIKTDFYDDVIGKYQDTLLNEDLIGEVSLSISTPVSEFISKIIAYILIFVAAIVVLSVLAFILDKMCKLPALKKMNSILGLLLGIVCAFINLILASSLISLVLNIIGLSNHEVSVAIMSEKTIVYGFINKLDIISGLMSIIKST